jgi:Tfp pilus assembly PilM family ATPase
MWIMSNTLYCSPNHLKLVVGEAAGKTVRISNFDEIELPAGGMINGIITDQEIMTKFFADVCLRYELGKADTRLIVDVNNIQVKPMNVPPLNEGMILEFVKREFNQYEDKQIDEDDTIYDYTVLETKNTEGGATILGVASPKSFIESYKNVFMSSGFKLTSIGLGLESYIKIAKFVPALSQGEVLLASVDGKQFSLAMFENGRYVIQNRYRLVQNEGSDEWVSEIGNNISSMVQFRMSQRTGTKIDSAFFAGVEEADILKLKEALGYLGIELNSLNIGRQIELTGKANTRGVFNPGRYLLNIGNLLKG